MDKILIIEDEEAIAELMQITLQAIGYVCEYVLDGASGANCLEKNHYDLILLDIMLPEIDGYELLAYCKLLDIPVIFNTAKGQLQDRVKGLHMGADDYIVKPFEIDELTARVEAVLRRYNKGKSMIDIENIKIDLKKRRVYKDTIEISLTPKEYELLIFLVKNKNLVLQRNQIIEAIWFDQSPNETRTLDLHIQRIRKKLAWKNKIKTVHRIGYILECEI